MSTRKLLALLVALALAGAVFAAFRFAQATQPDANPAPFISYRVNPRRHTIKLYWQDERGRPLRSLGSLRNWLASRGEQLVFATNGGMFHAGNRPVGLFVQEGRQLVPLDTAAGAGNFYLQPNGVFFLRPDNTAGICRTADFRRPHRGGPSRGSVRFATQSGPLLVLDGQLHPAFRPGSANVNIRSGVGLLPGGDVVFAQSRAKINFYDFADYFRQLGCRQALYLDGFVSRTYLPAQNWRQTDGDFGRYHRRDGRRNRLNHLA